MAGNNSAAEKTDPPSPFKLDQARKKGQVSKSMEVSSLFTFAAAIAAMVGLAGLLTDKTLELARRLFSSSGTFLFHREALGQWLGGSLLDMILIPLPVALIILVAGVLGNLVQTGLVFSTHPLKPDFKKLNPINGFKKIFNIRMLFDLVKSLLKLGALVGLTLWFLPILLPQWMTLSDREPSSALPFMLHQTLLVMVCIFAVLVLIAILDFAFTRWQFMKQMRMSKQEVKDEHKQRDGDPQVKQKRKEQQQALRQKIEGSSKLPGADVIITNPTHYAVAIQYNQNTMIAPVVLTKGVDRQAEQIRELARRHRIPIISRPPLARHLYRKTRINQAIPVESYLSVAKVLRDAYRLRNKSLLPDVSQK